MTNAATDNDHMPAARADVAALVAHRDEALAAFDTAMAALQAAAAAYRRAAPGGSIVGLSRVIAHPHSYEIERGDPARARERFRIGLDSECWRYLLTHSGLADDLDSQTRGDFEDEIQERPPAFGRGTIEATFSRLFGARETLMRQSLVNIFRRLTAQGWRSNGAFAVRRKTIVPRVMDGLTGRLALRGGRDLLQDVERVLCRLAGVPAPPAYGGIVGQIEAQTGWLQPLTGDAQTELLHVAWYKNGNAHVSIQRDDLVDAVNREIAAHYGATLAAKARRGGRGG